MKKSVIAAIAVFAIAQEPMQKEGKIAEISQDQSVATIEFDKGTEAQLNEVYAVFAEAEVVVDPVSGKKLFIREREVALLLVTGIEESRVTASVVSKEKDKTIAVGMRVLPSTKRPGRVPPSIGLFGVDIKEALYGDKVTIKCTVSDLDKDLASTKWESDDVKLVQFGTISEPNAYFVAPKTKKEISVRMTARDSGGLSSTVQQKITCGGTDPITTLRSLDVLNTFGSGARHFVRATLASNVPGKGIVLFDDRTMRLVVLDTRFRLVAASDELPSTAEVLGISALAGKIFLLDKDIRSVLEFNLNPDGTITRGSVRDISHFKRAKSLNLINGDVHIIDEISGLVKISGATYVTTSVEGITPYRSVSAGSVIAILEKSGNLHLQEATKFRLLTEGVIDLSAIGDIFVGLKKEKLILWKSDGVVFDERPLPDLPGIGWKGSSPKWIAPVDESRIAVGLSGGESAAVYDMRTRQWRVWGVPEMRNYAGIVVSAYGDRIVLFGERGGKKSPLVIMDSDGFVMNAFSDAPFARLLAISDMGMILGVNKEGEVVVFDHVNGTTKPVKIAAVQGVSEALMGAQSSGQNFYLCGSSGNIYTISQNGTVTGAKKVANLEGITPALGIIVNNAGALSVVDDAACKVKDQKVNVQYPLCDGVSGFFYVEKGRLIHSSTRGLRFVDLPPNVQISSIQFDNSSRMYVYDATRSKIAVFRIVWAVER